MFGIPDIVMLAESNIGGVSIVPTSFTVSYSQTGFPQIEISGLLDNKFNAERVIQQELKRFSLLDLMDEVSRRIKTGENKAEKMTRINKPKGGIAQ